MNAGRAALGTPHVQFAGWEVDVIPTQGHQLAGSQAVAVGDQDGRGVAMSPAVFPCSLNQLLDLPFGQVLAVPSRASHCFTYCRWSGVDSGNVFLVFSRFLMS